jgi:hypothetical protein
LPSPRTLDCRQAEHLELECFSELELSRGERSSLLGYVRVEDDVVHQVKLELVVTEGFLAPQAQGTSRTRELDAEALDWVAGPDGTSPGLLDSFKEAIMTRPEALKAKAS